MSSFCNGAFVDKELSWNTTNPNLTQCFRDTVLIGVPAAVLWISGPIWILLNRGGTDRNPSGNRYAGGNTRLSKFKTLILFALILNVVSELAIRIESSQRMHGSDLFMPICLLLTFTLSLALLFLEKRWGHHSSWPQFAFYFLLFIGTVPTFKVQIEGLIDVPGDWQLWLRMISFCPVIGIALLLNSWADFSLKPDEHEPMETYCSVTSQIFFSWMGGLVRRGYRSPLTFEDFPNTPPELDVGRNALEFLKRLRSRFDRSTKASLWPVLLLTYGPRFLSTFVIAIIHFSLTFVSPQILKLLIRYISSEEEATWKGYFYAFVLFCSSMIWTLSFHRYIHDMCKIALQMRSSVVSVIYRKAMRLSSKARRSFTVGEITNYVSVDAQRIVTTTPYLHGMWGAPYMVCLAIFFLYQELGASAFAGVGVLVLLIPFNVWSMRVTEQLQETQLKAKDERIKLVNEALTGMKVLKLYAWENPFMKRIEDIRNGEIFTLRKAANIWAFLNFTFACSPFLVTVAIFAVYVALDPVGHVLTAEKIFVTISLFNLIRIPLIMFPFSIFETTKMFVSINRINKFLQAEELDPNTVSDRLEKEQNCIEMKNASFSWGGDVNSDTHEDASGVSSDGENSPQVVLNNINLGVKKGSLVAVVGVVGSGKSSLLSAMLGEMQRTEGAVNVKGKVAYVSQQAWIQNMTLRDNILFRADYMEDKYNKILEACALNADLDVLPGGDKTEIGENGINLSGGQKQRISLARAVYSDSEIYLFDDPLSAVDAHVGKHIFNEVISSDTGVLRDRTRILVTHGIGFLDKVDQIYVMKDGAIAEVGSYVELMANKGAFSEFLTTYQKEGTKSATDTSSEVSRKRRKTISTSSIGIPIHRQLRADSRHPSGASPRSWAHFQFAAGHDEDDDYSVIRSRSARENDSDDRADSAFSVQRETQPLFPREDDGQLVEDEVAMVGRVKWSVYLKYIENIGTAVAVFCVLMYFVGQGLQIGANAWLSVWADENEKNNGSSTVEKTLMYLGVYSGIGISACFSEVLRELALFVSCVRASKVIHERLLRRIFRTPMSFFDTNPIGRIVNRFSSDIDTVDNTIPFELTDFSYCFFEVLGVIAVISYSTPLFLTVFPPIFCVYFFVQRYYIATSRQLKRIESIKKSPLFSHFSESVNGVSTIRAFKQQDRFCLESEEHVMNSVRCFYLSVSSNRWLGVRIETIGNFVVLFAAIFAVLSRGLISPGLAGLSITYSLNMTDSLNWLVRMLCDLETNSVSIERILEYSDNPQEADVEIPEREMLLPQEWPEHGAISFQDFATRYRPGLDLVLKGVDMDIGAGEKVGICGRTGAGKSSLTLALFRIVEAARGKITIDGHDISELGLHKLRSSLTIIPQDPVLFTGNIRFNLDPTTERTDEEIWRALELAHLKKHVTTLSDGLHHEVSEGGENFSVGQRQLICLARALLRKTKILILDEATAAVDLETDDLIQTTIRCEFSDCTVLTIAHRLNTIMDSTKIAVFEDGKLVEFAQPKKLLDTAGSALSALAKDAAL